MADFTALKTAIQNAIKQNGNEDITGNLLQEVLLAIVTTLGDGSINELITALGTEATTRGNADTELGGRIDGVVSSIEAINDAIENGYVYAGIAIPSSTPASGKVFYLALTAGTYTNFGNTAVTQGINILKYNGSAWSLDAFVGIDDTPTPSSNNLVKSGGAFDEVMKNGSAFDLSAYNGGATYADLNAALTALNALPSDFKKGGMSMKFVLTSDNKYVQYRLMANAWSTTESDWQGVDDEPTAGSDNLVKSGGVAGYVTASQNSQTGGIDLSVGQNDYNIAAQSDLRNAQGIQYQKSLTVIVGNPPSPTISLVQTLRKGQHLHIKIETNDASFSFVGVIINGSTATEDRLFWGAMSAGTTYNIDYIATRDITTISFSTSYENVLTAGTVNFDIEIESIYEQINNEVARATTAEEHIIESLTGYKESKQIAIATTGPSYGLTLIQNPIYGKTYKICMYSETGASSLVGILINGSSQSADRIYWGSLVARQEKIISYTVDRQDVETIAFYTAYTSVTSAGTVTFDITLLGDCLKKPSNLIVVDKNGGGDYTELYDAMNYADDSPTNPVTILVMPGKYEMPRDTMVRRGNRYLSIVGVDKNNCIVYNNVGKYNISNIDDSPLKLSGNCYVANLTVISNSTDYADSDTEWKRAYCIHIDYDAPADTVTEIHNCRLINDHFVAVGIGLRNKFTVKITGCDIISNIVNTVVEPETWSCVYCHDGTSVSDWQHLFMKDNTLTCNYKAIRVGNPNHNSIDVSFVNNVVDTTSLSDIHGVNMSKLCFGNNDSSLNKTL